MRKDDALHDKDGNHRTEPPKGMSRARFDNEMRAHMEGDHLFWKHVAALITGITTEESKDDDSSSARKAPPRPREASRFSTPWHPSSQ